MLSEVFVRVILALVFGATIGLERESSRHNEASAGGVGGIRTFALIDFAGYLEFGQARSASDQRLAHAALVTIEEDAGHKMQLVKSDLLGFDRRRIRTGMKAAERRTFQELS